MDMAFAHVEEVASFLRRLECSINVDLTETVVRICGRRQWRTGAAL